MKCHIVMRKFKNDCEDKLGNIINAKNYSYSTVFNSEDKKLTEKIFYHSNTARYGLPPFVQGGLQGPDLLITFEERLRPLSQAPLQRGGPLQGQDPRSWNLLERLGFKAKLSFCILPSL